MGKAGKSTRKFAKKHLKAAIEKRQKTKPLRQAWKRKKAAIQISQQSGTRKDTAESSGKDVDDSTMKMKSDKMKHSEVDFIDGTGIEDDSSVDDDASESDGMLSENENDSFYTLPREDEDNSSEEENGADNALEGQNKLLQSEVDKHMEELEQLKEKDPKFVKFLKKHEKELLQFDDDDDRDEKENIKESVCKSGEIEVNEQKVLNCSSKKVLTTPQVDTWCQEIIEKKNIEALHCLLRAFQTACHYGDSEKHGFSNISIRTSKTFNKIVIFVLSEMDGVFRKLLGLPGLGGKREAILEMQHTGRWSKIGNLIKSYFSNTINLLNQMADNQIISFTLQRLRSSIIFLAAFPSYLHKLLKVAFHFWGSGGESLSAVSCLFFQDAAIQLGSDCLDFCLKRIYKVFAANCKLVNPSNCQHIQFLKSCIVDLYGVDLATTYNHACLCIQQLGKVLQLALTLNTKEVQKKVYSCQYINCVDLWVKFVCAYTKHVDLQSLSYAMSEIIIGVCRLVPTVRYAPLKLQCVKMLNTLTSASGTFIPVASILFDVLKCRELDKMRTGGAAEVCDFSTILKVPKAVLKSRAFQDECVYSVIDHLAEHLAQWSYDIAFPELGFTILIHLQRFHGKTSIDRFRRQMKQLMDQVERNVEYVMKKREEVSFSPKDHAAVSKFLQAEKEKGASPLSKFYASLRQKAELRKASLQKASVLVQDEKSAILTNGTVSTSHRDSGCDVIKVREVFSKDNSPEKNETSILNFKKREKSTSLDNAFFTEDIKKAFSISSDKYDDNTINSKEHDGEGQDQSEGKGKTTEGRISKAHKSLAKRIKSGKIRSLKKQRLDPEMVNVISRVSDP